MTVRDQRRRAWETGEVSPEGDGWDAGYVENEGLPMGEGSQTPPAKDRDGEQIEVPGIFTPEDVERVASKWMKRVAKTASMKRTKTAGEVRFIKDRSGDEKQWGWPPQGPAEREITGDYKFNPSKLKPLATTLRASLMALGHAMSAYQTFSKTKSATISPDGNLGGRGYIQKIAEMRRQYMNIIEALSACTDTIYDEINAPHWDPAIEGQDPREREEVQEIMEDVEEIKKDPEEFAQEEEAEMDAENGKKASRRKRASYYETDHYDYEEACLNEDVLADIKSESVPFLKAMNAGFQSRGWRVDKSYPFGELDSPPQDGIIEVAFWVQGKAGQRIQVGRDSIVLDRDIGEEIWADLLLTEFEGVTTGWSGGTGHPHDPASNYYELPVDCDTGVPDKIRMNWWGRKISYPVSVAGAKKALQDFDKLWPAKFKVRSKRRRRAMSRQAMDRTFRKLVMAIKDILEEAADPEDRRRARHFADLYSPRGPVREKWVEGLFFDTDAADLWMVSGDSEEDFEARMDLMGEVNKELLRQGVIGRKVVGSQDPTYVTDIDQFRIRRVAAAHHARHGGHV
jgi:hypothetical protein